jgi:hypothetical protein
VDKSEHPSASFAAACEVHLDARWRWHLARERGLFQGMLEAEIAAAAAAQRMEAALAAMGADPRTRDLEIALARLGFDARSEFARDVARQNEAMAAAAPFWNRIARGEEGESGFPLPPDGHDGVRPRGGRPRY